MIDIRVIDTWFEVHLTDDSATVVYNADVIHDFCGKVADWHRLYDDWNTDPRGVAVCEQAFAREYAHQVIAQHTASRLVLVDNASGYVWADGGHYSDQPGAVELAGLVDDENGVSGRGYCLVGSESAVNETGYHVYKVPASVPVIDDGQDPDAIDAVTSEGEYLGFVRCADRLESLAADIASALEDAGKRHLFNGIEPNHGSDGEAVLWPYGQPVSSVAEALAFADGVQE